MTEPMASAATTAVQLARIEGKLETLAAKMDAGDREGKQGNELLKQRIEQVARQAEHAERAVTVEKEHREAALSTVRVDLERQLRLQREDLKLDLERHATDVAPHPSSLGDAIATVATELTAARSAWKTITVIGSFVAGIAGAIAAAGIVKYIG